MKTIITASIVLMTIITVASLCAIEIGEYTDPSKVVKSAPGMVIIITLQSNKTTGYEWQLAAPLDTKVIDFMKTEYIANEPQVMGSGGTEVWSFRAIGAGSAKIELKYVRPWEKDADPAKRIAFDVDVIEPASEDAAETEY
jgi:inhibitor of cysteine peptidase